MKISELICELEEAKSFMGNVDVFFNEDIGSTPSIDGIVWGTANDRSVYLFTANNG